MAYKLNFGVARNTKMFGINKQLIQRIKLMCCLHDHRSPQDGDKLVYNHPLATYWAKLSGKKRLGLLQEQHPAKSVPMAS